MHQQVYLNAVCTRSFSLGCETTGVSFKKQNSRYNCRCTEVDQLTFGIFTLNNPCDSYKQFLTRVLRLRGLPSVGAILVFGILLIP